ncbi:hypothetical protein FB451DRAFT_1207813 [Mycena latifolia]|nr:hypothetical protein FB451DRAFT_1207813 [Mycena latifolia]
MTGSVVALSPIPICRASTLNKVGAREFGWDVVQQLWDLNLPRNSDCPDCRVPRICELTNLSGCMIVCSALCAPIY